MPELKAEHLLNIRVHGVCGLKFTDKEQASTLPEPYVDVLVFGEVKRTITGSGVAFDFEAFFSIGKEVETSEFEESDVTLNVYHSYWKGAGSQLMGSVTFGLDMVYEQPDHMFRKSWVPIALPEDPASVTGFLSVTIGVYKPGDSVPRQANNIDDDEEGGASLKSRVIDPPMYDSKNLYQLYVYVYNAEGLRPIQGTFSTSISPFVQVSFNGTEQETTVEQVTEPQWNQEIKVPFNHPTFDDSIGVLIASKGGMTGSDTEIGSESLSIKELMKNQQKPLWYNFYAAEVDGGAHCVFGGRLLIGAMVTRTEKGALGVSATSARPPPEVRNCVLMLDLYMLCFDVQEPIDECWVTISLAELLVDKVTPPPKPSQKTKNTYIYSDKDGRIPEIELSLPPDDSCADLILSIFTKKSSFYGDQVERHMYKRLTSEELFAEGADEIRWLECLVASNGEYETNAGFMLCSACLKEAGSKRPQREKHISDHLRRYTFRASVHQAVNMPPADPIGSSDCYVVIFFGPAYVVTPIYLGSLCPVWHRCVSAQVELPEADSMRPDILIFILDKDADGDEPLAMYRYDVKETGNLPTQWTKNPTWLELDEAPGGPLTQGKILCSFEMFPIEDTEKFYKDSDVYPETIDTVIDIFIIGIRMLDGEELGNPWLQIGFGRKDRDKDDIWTDFRKSKNTAIGKHHGSNGCYNLLEKITLKNCGLCEHPLFQDFLEIKLYADDEDDPDTTKQLCSASIHLTPHVPWVAKEVQQHVEAAHRCLRVSEVRQMDVLQKEGKYEPIDPNAVADEDHLLLPQSADLGQSLVSGADGGEGGHEEEIEESEAKMKEEAKDAQMKKAKDVLAQAESTLANKLGWENCGEVEKSNVHGSTVYEYICVTEQQQEYYQEAYEEGQEIGSRKAGWDSDADAFTRMMNQFKKSFQWTELKEENAETFGGHIDIDDEIERENEQLKPSKLPYLKTALFKGNDAGSQEQVGTIKYMIKIYEKQAWKDNGDQIQREIEKFESKVENMKAACAEAKNLVVRSYVLACDGLAPVSGNSECATYIWTFAASEKSGTHSIRERGTVREHTLNPEFNTFHRIPRINFPENANYTIRVMEKVRGLVSGETEEEIGSSHIDLEDRWFHPRYRQMVNEGTTPIEARRLFGQHSNFGKGHVRLWLDMIAEKDVEKVKQMTLPSTEPQDFQLRLAIFKVTDILTVDGSVPAVQLVVRMYPDGGGQLEQQTDTHNNAADGTATFNWRFLLPVKVPCGNAKITFTTWNIGNITSDMIAQVTLDLARDFNQARKTGLEVDLGRGKVRMYHSNEPGKVKGQLDIQALLLSKGEAESRRVGEGREEPNEDPFLDPEDPHLLKGREGMGAKLANVAAAVGNGLMMGAKMAMIMLALKVAGGACAAAFSAFMMYKMSSS